MADSALLTPRNWALVEHEYANSGPYHFAVLDTFLGDEALTAVRRHLSQRWGDQAAALATQSVTDIAEVAVIAEELRALVPTILGPHRLSRGWAFMNQQNSALKVHADVGAVTLNIWLTPDEHNLDPQTGGLVLLDVKHEPDSMGGKLESAEWAERNLVRHPLDRTVTVPYRYNRAVLFDARTFHGSDRVLFDQDDPDTRRVNMSLIYA